MGILERFGAIMSSNVNAMLDKMEDPAKMIDQAMRDLEKDLGAVKSQTAAVMAEETRIKREMDETEAEMKKFAGYAEKAVIAGNDDDAMKFLQEKNRKAERFESLKQSYELAASNALKMRQMHDKLQKEITTLNERKAAIKAKIAAANTQEKLNKLAGSTPGSGAASSFERMEEKANRMLDEANAKAELNMPQSDMPDTSKYDDMDKAANVQDELAALKERLRGNG